MYEVLSRYADSGISASWNGYVINVFTATTQLEVEPRGAIDVEGCGQVETSSGVSRRLPEHFGGVPAR